MDKTTLSKEEQIQGIHYILKDLFPDAVSVEVFVNSEGIEVNPKYRTNVKGFTMQDISGNWIKKG